MNYLCDREKCWVFLLALGTTAVLFAKERTCLENFTSVLLVTLSCFLLKTINFVSYAKLVTNLHDEAIFTLIKKINEGLKECRKFSIMK